MRKYILSIIILSIISMFLSGCMDIGNSDIYKISPPKETDSEIIGTWQVEDFINQSNENSERDTKHIDEVYFGENIASFNNESINEPQYKAKYVDLEEYMQQHKISKIKLFDDIKSTQVIQISSQDKVFYEAIVLKENKIAIFCDKGFYILNRVSDEVVNDAAVEKRNDMFSIEDVKPITNLKETGILLGLKHVNEQGVNVYRTIWISYNENLLGKIFEINGILVPRLNGFYNVDVKRLQEESINKDVILSKQLNSNEKIPMKVPKDKKNIERQILFVGNNYISTNVIEYDNYKKVIDNYYEVIPVDNTFIDSGISLSHIYGETKENPFEDAANLFFKRNIGIDKEKISIDDACFAIERRNGNWRLKGGVKTTKGLGSFNINALPPKIMVNYDDLYIPWSYITDKFPNVKDAYTSPNNKLLLLITDKNIEVYEIKNNILKDNPDAQIPLYNNETSVMSEWATGSYVLRWEEVSKQQGKELKIDE